MLIAAQNDPSPSIIWRNKDKWQLDFEKHDIQNGDKIYTSGKEGIFNPGTPIGEAKVEKDQVTVSLFSNLDQITFVNIVLGEKQKKN